MQRSWPTCWVFNWVFNFPGHLTISNMILEPERFIGAQARAAASLASQREGRKNSVQVEGKLFIFIHNFPIL